MNLKDARAAGCMFFDGRPCPHGHGTTRYVSCGKCKECIQQRASAYRNLHRDSLAKNAKEYRKANKNSVNAKRRQYVKSNKEKIRAQKKQYQKDNIAKILDYNRKWISENRERARIAKQNYARRKRVNDPVFVLKQRLRCRIREALRGVGATKSKRTEAILGCSIEAFRAQIESMFSSGMSWSRLSEIHIDHIVPLSAAKTEEDVLRLFHHTNMQPLWAGDNLRKGARVPCAEKS